MERNGQQMSVAPAGRKPCGCSCGRPTHGDRRYRHGHKPKTLRGRILANILITDSDCWEWQGARHQEGYGHIYIPGTKPSVYRSTHRVLYEIEKGPIPDGLFLDHLCRNPPCCNPDHLEPVTPRENSLRGQNSNILLHLAGVCSNGHSLSEHACRRKSTGAVAYCRLCVRIKRESQRAGAAE